VNEGIFFGRFLRAFILFIIFTVFFVTIPGLGGKTHAAAAAPPGERNIDMRFWWHFFDPPDDGTLGELLQQPTWRATAFTSKALISDKTTTTLRSYSNCEYSELKYLVCNSLSIDKYFADSCGERSAVSSTSTLPIPAISIIFDRYGNYDPHSSWRGVDPVDLLARAMLAEENNKLCDPEKDKDFLGAGWVMVNRTQVDDGYFDYAEGSIERAVLSFQQFAITGTKRCQQCPLLPGNAAIVADPESYIGWFGGNPRASYWKSYSIAIGILNGDLSDPTYGALFFSDASYDDNGGIVTNKDGRTRFKYYIDGNNYTIDELEKMRMPPWP